MDGGPLAGPATNLRPLGRVKRVQLPFVAALVEGWHFDLPVQARVDPVQLCPGVFENVIHGLSLRHPGASSCVTSCDPASVRIGNIAPVTPSEFAAKWSASKVKESAGSKEHFIDLCQMLEHATPTAADPTGDWYAFEKGASKTTGGDGYADVWKRGHFGWEYKGKKKDLAAAYQQLLNYREALENPPLLVVSDMDVIEIHTNFTNTVKQVHRITLDDLKDNPKKTLPILRAVMGRPEELKPTVTQEDITREAAKQYAKLALSIRSRGHDPQLVAHFLNKLLFTMFAEDSDLLPAGLLRRLINSSLNDPETFSAGLSELFEKMSDKGGLFGTDRIQWFNGGLFDGPQVIEMTKDEIRTVSEVARLDWSQVEPAIFGTLFERGLDPAKRSQLGAHYTDREAIERLVIPVVIDPLRREFEAMKARVMAIGPWRHVTKATPIESHPGKQLQAFLDLLRSVTVLDPACGSGNFLYVALQALKDLEREASIWGSEVLRVPMQFTQIGPESVKGIEINLYAAEIARVVIWIGEIQWMIGNGFSYRRDPILRPLDNIENRDALIDWSDSSNPTEAEWPKATYIVGNPPFLGSRYLRRRLGDEFVDALFRIFGDRLPETTDFVTYWHEKARATVEAGQVQRVGLLATQGIRGQANRKVLERIKASGDIFMAWSDEPWVLEGANVRVSFLAYDNGSETTKTLDGVVVPSINTDLTAGFDLTTAKRLTENTDIAFQGNIKSGPFEVPGELARSWLDLPNPDGRSNRDVLRPWANGLDVLRRPLDLWIVDFGFDMDITEASLYEVPFKYVEEHVKPFRTTARDATAREKWWLHHRRRPELTTAISGLDRYIVTARVAKHRLFTWLPKDVIADNALVVVARDDDYTLGVLQSRFHVRWSRLLGTQLEDRPRYTPTSGFETFPFPTPTPTQRVAVAEVAARLVELRHGWLNPSGLEDKELAKRTLTNLYNEPPAWLRQTHDRLDEAVADAYGWPPATTLDDAIQSLLALNQARPGKPIGRQKT